MINQPPAETRTLAHFKLDAVLYFGDPLSAGGPWDGKMVFDISRDNGKNHPLYAWDGAQWKNGAVWQVQKEIKRRWMDDPVWRREGIPSGRNYNDIIRTVEIEHARSMEEVWNQEERVIPFRNYYVNTISPLVIKPRPKMYFTYALDCDYDPKAQCPMFMKFLTEVCPASSLEMIQRYAGYCLYPSVRFRKFLILIGPRGAGKGTFIQILQDVIGQAHCEEINITQLGDKNNGFLEGKLLGYYDDLKGGALKDISRAKVLADKKAITYEDKFMRKHNGKNITHYIFAGNTLPTLPTTNESADSIEAFLERAMIDRWTHQTPEADRDKYLADRIVKHERQGVLNWMLAGLHKLVRSNGDFTYAHQTSILEWLATSIPLARYLLEGERYELSKEKNAMVSVKNLFEAVNEWCAREGEQSYPRPQDLGRHARLVGLVTKQRLDKDQKKIRVYWGLKKKTIIIEGNENTLNI